MLGYESFWIQVNFYYVTLMISPLGGPSVAGYELSWITSILTASCFANIIITRTTCSWIGVVLDTKSIFLMSFFMASQEPLISGYESF